MTDLPDASLPPGSPSPYAGRWVAILRGQVIAQGNSREQVLEAARRLRYKETPEVKFMSVLPTSISSYVECVRAALPDGNDAYLVGGVVRDLLLNRPIHDLDFAVSGNGLALARKVAESLPHAAFYALDEATDTGRVVIQPPEGPRIFLDFAAFRGEDLQADLRGRDFTINAIAMDLQTEKLIDPHGGALDLREKRLRACSPEAFTDDPIRILRGVRLAAGLGFTIETQTRQWMKDAVSLLGKPSPERFRDELFKILDGPRPETSLRALELLGGFQVPLPEIDTLTGVEQSAPHVYDVWTHTLAVLRHLNHILVALAPAYDEDRANADLYTGLLVLRLGRYRQQLGDYFGGPLNPERSMRSLLLFAALYHDICKPETKTIEPDGRIRFLGHEEKGSQAVVRRGIALRLSNGEIDFLRTVIKNHMRIHDFAYRLVHQNEQPTRRAIYRFFRDTGTAGVALVLLSLADTRAVYEQTLPQEHWAACLDVSRALLEAWYETSEQVVSPPSLVNGDDLMSELGLKPGSVLGKLLEAIREAQAEGILISREQALDFSRRWLAGQN